MILIAESKSIAETRYPVMDMDICTRVFRLTLARSALTTLNIISRIASIGDIPF